MLDTSELFRGGQNAVLAPRLTASAEINGAKSLLATSHASKSAKYLVYSYLKCKLEIYAQGHMHCGINQCHRSSSVKSMYSMLSEINNDSNTDLPNDHVSLVSTSKDTSIDVHLPMV